MSAGWGPRSTQYKVLNVTAVNPTIASLLHEPGLTSLALGKPREALRGRLQALTDADLVAPSMVRDSASAAACRAALWLYFDFFEEAHSISQELHTGEGSYWHAILHRREPDYGNAKYWFRRVGRHPIYETLHAEAVRLAKAAPTAAAFLTSQASWDSFAFVDLCEAAEAGQASCRDLCLAVQRREWELLFEYCMTLA